MTDQTFHCSQKWLMCGICAATFPSQPRTDVAISHGICPVEPRLPQSPFRPHIPNKPHTSLWHLGWAFKILRSGAEEAPGHFLGNKLAIYK